MAAKLDLVAGVSGLEVNISCPNLKCGGVEFGTTAAAASLVTAAVRKSTSLPVWVKLTPNTADVPGIARAVVEAGADALVLINTLKGLAVDIKTRRPVLGNITGGLSGPVLKPVALRIVYEVAACLPNVPLIGSGGILSPEDAIEFFIAGATAVQIGTANLIDPAAPARIMAGIRDYLSREGFNDIRELTSSLKI